MRSFLTVPTALAVLTSSIAGLAAQDLERGRMRFDIVSVKPNKSDDTNLRLDIQPGGRMVAANMPLLQFIRAAYTLQLSQIVGAPSWVERERFDIVALTTQDLSAPTLWKPGLFAPVQLMMQDILFDRFKLKAHTEARESDGYALILREPGSHVGKLRVHVESCTPTTCGMQIGPGSVRASGVPLPQLAELLSQLTDRLVLDTSGLDGAFDFGLEWTPEGTPGDGPSLFTALQEQLGVRLESRMVPRSRLVIDSIARPDPD